MRSGSDAEFQEPPERHGRHGSFGLVARIAGGDEIGELVRAAPAAGDDVVDGRWACAAERRQAVRAARATGRCHAHTISPGGSCQIFEDRGERLKTRCLMLVALLDLCTGAETVPTDGARRPRP